MKHPFRIFELSKNEQCVVLILIFVLITIAFIAYERRVHPLEAQPTSASTPNPAPTGQSPFKPGIRP
jgi:hypothetical protein